MTKENTPIIHQLSRKHSRSWKIPEAILLSYMAARVRKSKNKREGKRWFYNTAEEIATRFPYWNPKQVDEIIQRLRKKKLIEIGNFNKWSPDKTRWFTVPEDIMKMAAEDPVYFWIEHAQRYGIRPALVLFNLENNIEKRQKKDKSNIYHPLIPAQLAKLLPISEREIERIITKLRDAGAVVQLKPRSSEYSLPNIIKATPPISGTPPSETGQTPPESGEPPSKSGSNTHYKPFETIERPFETPQAAPAAESSSSGDVDEQISQSPTDAITLADHFFLCDYANVKEGCDRIRDQSGKHLDSVIQTAAGSCDEFIKTLSSATIYNLGGLNNPDKLLDALVLPLEAFFRDKLSKDVPFQLSFQLFTISLDILISAFLCVARHSGQDTALVPCYSYAYDLCLTLGKHQELEDLRRDIAIFDQSCADCASVDADKEEIHNLPSAQKARILRNAVQSKNLAGWFFATEENIHIHPRWKNNVLTWSHSTLASAEEFFDRNSDASVSEVCEILNKCVRIFLFEVYSKDEPDDPYWNSRRAVDLSFFLARIEKVLKELGDPHSWIAPEEPHGR